MDEHSYNDGIKNIYELPDCYNAKWRHMGFQIIGTDETDGMGKPYPILHLQLKEATVEKSKSKG